MLELKYSRGPMIDLDQCIENVGGNRYDLVLVASIRAKEIKRKNRMTSMHVVSALFDVQNENIDRKYLKGINDDRNRSRHE